MGACCGRAWAPVAGCVGAGVRGHPVAGVRLHPVGRWGTAQEDLRVLSALSTRSACVGACCGRACCVSCGRAWASCCGRAFASCWALQAVRGLRACVGILLRACVSCWAVGDRPGRPQGAASFWRVRLHPVGPCRLQALPCRLPHQWSGLRPRVCAKLPTQSLAASNAPDLFRPPKLSGAGPGSDVVWRTSSGRHMRADAGHEV